MSASSSDIECTIPQNLNEDHLNDLRKSGLTDATIANSGITSVNGHDIKNRFRPVYDDSYMLIPCPDIDGCLTATRYRVKVPPNRATGGRKYLGPKGVPSFVYFPPGFRERMAETKWLIITEGEKKTLSLHQMGYLAIGLTGVWNWGKKFEDDDGSKQRKLNDDMSSIPWDQLDHVTVLFDTDPKIKSDVLHAACELRRALHSNYIRNVNVGELPETRDSDGTIRKCAVDDLLYDLGEDQTKEIIDTTRPKTQVLDLANHRTSALAKRRRVVKQRGVLLIDMSPTGVGKTTADIDAIAETDENVLVVCDTHDNGDEFLTEARKKGVDVAKIPKMVFRDNCTNSDAEQAMNLGFAPGAVVCPSCPFKAGCSYLTEKKFAESARVLVTTHRRFQLTSQDDEGRPLIFVEENLDDALSQHLEIDETDIKPLTDLVVAASRLYIKSVAKEPYSVQERRWHLMEKSLQHLKELFRSRSCEFSPPWNEPLPRSYLWFVYQAIRESDEAEESGNKKKTKIDVRIVAIQFLIAIMSGKLRSLRTWQDESEVQHLAGICVRDIRRTKTIISSDASVATDSMIINLALPNHRIETFSSYGQQPLFHLIHQICVPINRGTSREKFLGYLRLAMVRNPDKRKFGVITHSTTKQYIDSLEPILRKRITRIAHFGGTDIKGSNSWLNECDCLIVIGNPRVGPEAIKRGVHELFGPESTLESSQFSITDEKERGVYWNIETESGELRTIRYNTYHNRKFARAERRFLVQGLLQAVGRARANLEIGIPVTVVSDIAFDDRAIGFDYDIPVSEVCMAVLLYRHLQLNELAKRLDVGLDAVKNSRRNLKKIGLLEGSELSSNGWRLLQAEE